MTTLEQILAKHASIRPTVEAMATYAAEVHSLCAQFIFEQVNTLPTVTVLKRTLAATLDPSETPRSAEAKIEALKSQWPEGNFEVVFDVQTSKYFVFVL